MEDARGDGVDVLALAPFRCSLREQRGENPGGFHAVGDVRLAAAPVLAVVPALGEERRSDDLRVAEYRVRGAVHAAQHDGFVGVGIVLRVLAEHELLAHAFPQLRHQEEAGDWEEDPGGGEHGEYVDVEADGVVVGEAREEVRVGVEVEGVRVGGDVGDRRGHHGVHRLAHRVGGALHEVREIPRAHRDGRRAEIFRGVPIRAGCAPRPRPTPRSRRFGGRRGPRPRRQRAGTAGSAHLPHRRVPRDNPPAKRASSRPARPRSAPRAPRSRRDRRWRVERGFEEARPRRWSPAHVRLSARGRALPRAVREDDAGTRSRALAVESRNVPGVLRCAAETWDNGHRDQTRVHDPGIRHGWENTC